MSCFLFRPDQPPGEGMRNDSPTRRFPVGTGPSEGAALTDQNPEGAGSDSSRLILRVMKPTDPTGTRSYRLAHVCVCLSVRRSASRCAGPSESSPDYTDSCSPPMTPGIPSTGDGESFLPAFTRTSFYTDPSAPPVVQQQVELMDQCKKF